VNALRALLAVTLVGFVVLPVGCLLEGFGRQDVTTIVDAGSDVVESDAVLCAHKIPPPVPTDAQPGATEDFVVALRTVDMREGQGAEPIGYDLDKTCSCQGEVASCREPGKKPICDGTEGVDNQAAKIFRLIQGGAGGPEKFGSGFFSAGAETGIWSILMRVRGYNGKADDDTVEFDWYPPASGAHGPDGGPPLWDGTDTWPISSTGLADGVSIDNPKFRNIHAYVTNHVLVASLPASFFSLGGSGISGVSMRLTGGIVTATIIESDAGGYALRDGIISARWVLSDLFASLSSYRDSNGDPICIGTVTYNFGKSTICSSADILSGTGGPSDPCDALSLGLGFTADPARLGTPIAPIMPEKFCPDGGDPINDTCAN